MRETLQEAAKRLLTSPVGSEHTISIDTNDGKTGQPPGPAVHNRRVKHNPVVVQEESRADGKKRIVVRLKTGKENSLATTPWA